MFDFACSARPIYPVKSFWLLFNRDGIYFSVYSIGVKFLEPFNRGHLISDYCIFFEAMIF